jgi:sporulation protein YlmC with PRC-barrel domain
MNAFPALPSRPKLAALAAIVAAALAGAASAQQPDSPRENANRPPAAQSQTQIARSDTGMQTLEQHLRNKPIRVSKLVGMELQNRGGDNLGEVRDILGSTSPGQDMQVIVSIGGVGVDDRLVAVPFDEIQINADGDELYTTQTADQLASAPAITLDSRPAASPGAANETRTARDGAASERRIGDLVGAEVVDSGGDNVGEIDDIVISTAGSDSVRAVLQVGGLAGVGEKRISLPLSQLDVERSGSDNEPTVRVAMDADALQRMPEFEYEEDTAAL